MKPERSEIARLRRLVATLVKHIGIEHKEKDCRAEKRVGDCATCQLLRRMRRRGDLCDQATD